MSMNYDMTGVSKDDEQDFDPSFIRCHWMSKNYKFLREKHIGIGDDNLCQFGHNLTKIAMVVSSVRVRRKKGARGRKT